jgi:hypothetical protein
LIETGGKEAMHKLKHCITEKKVLEERYEGKGREGSAGMEGGGKGEMY